MDKISNKLFYQKSVEEFGVSAQGVHWNNKYTQYKRFEIITKLIKKEITTSTIVDVGCGFAEYYNYLLTNKKKPMKYVGIDCESYMIKVSKRRFPYNDFKQLDILQDDLVQADYYIASGTFNLMTPREIEIVISKCYFISNKGLIFNFLKDITFTDVTKNDILNICIKLSSNIIVKDHYLENDFTVFLKR